VRVAWQVSGEVDLPQGAGGALRAEPADFADGRFPRGAVTLPAGQDTAEITVKVIGDRVPEIARFTDSADLFALRLQQASGGFEIAGGPALGRIRNDDRAAARDERLRGDDGNDALRGFAGNDTILASRGRDLLDGGPGVDTVNFARAEAPVFVHLGVGIARGGLGPDTLLAFENAVGSAQDDVLIGNDRFNELRGGAGNDFLRGLGGPDRLIGNAGQDAVAYTRAEAGVSVNLRTGEAFGGQGPDRLFSIEKALGSDFADSFVGTDGQNVFRGGAGDDRFDGRGGPDFLFGGRGDDLFLVQPGHGADSIADFVAGAGGPDRIDLSQIPGLNSFADVRAATDDSSGRAVIATGGDGDEIRLPGVLRSDLAADDFLF
jgi:Ca2+-binding RTX toxin-like protein